ncbi:MAG: hypothetical protein HFJ09_06050 [Lachnospiraceae bacterium]|nr:hypothetical protein [Lachnospiraceae bacterium]
MKRATSKMMVLFIIALLGASGGITQMQKDVMAATTIVAKPIQSSTFTVNVKVEKSVKLSEIVSKELLVKSNLKTMSVTKKGIVSCKMNTNWTDSIIRGKKKGKTTLFFAEKSRSNSRQKYSKMVFSVTVSVE